MKHEDFNDAKAHPVDKYVFGVAIAVAVFLAWLEWGAA